MLIPIVSLSNKSAGIYLFNVNKRSTRPICEICVNLTRHQRHSSKTLVTLNRFYIFLYIFLLCFHCRQINASGKIVDSTTFEGPGSIHHKIYCIAIYIYFRFGYFFSRQTKVKHEIAFNKTVYARKSCCF